MSSVCEAIIDVCARTETQYGFKIRVLTVSQGDFNKIRTETDWCKHLNYIGPNRLLFDGVEVAVVDA